MGTTRQILEANSRVRESLNETMGHVPAHKRETVSNKLQALFNLYEEGHNWRVPNQFNVEGKLDDGRQFYALKVMQVRCYGWYDRGNFVISHFIFKKQQKLSKADRDVVQRNYAKWFKATGE